jgi:hypothetical protein
LEVTETPFTLATTSGTGFPFRVKGFSFATSPEGKTRTWIKKIKIRIFLVIGLYIKICETALVEINNSNAEVGIILYLIDAGNEAGW